MQGAVALSVALFDAAPAGRDARPHHSDSGAFVSSGSSGARRSSNTIAPAPAGTRSNGRHAMTPFFPRTQRHFLSGDGGSGGLSDASYACHERKRSASSG